MKKMVAVVIGLLLSLGVFAKPYAIKHIEPLSWWVGMQHHTLQLMVNGEDIAALTPSIRYPGVTLVNVEKTDNKNFLFINLRIAENTKPGRFNIVFKQGDKQQVEVGYQLNARRKGSAERRGFDAKDAIYLLMPDRFANGNPRNDNNAQLLESANRNITGGRHGGDIAGIKNHLKYIADLGFTMLWSTPLLENNQPSYSYHGYSQTDLYRVDPRFGSNADYRQLVAAAHQQGLGVIQDIVLNHIGSGHWWMKDMPASDWLNNPKNFKQTTHRRSTVHDIHAAVEDLHDFTDGWFVASMPDLNQRNPLVATYLMQNSVWWIEYADLSGIREDTYSYSDRNFLSHWGKYILDEYPHFNMVGEEWTANQAIVASWQKGKVNRDGYVSYLPSLMDFPVMEALRSSMTDKEGWDTGLIKLYETIANDFIYADPMHMVVFAENHDTSRIFSVLDNDLGRYKNAMVFIATTRGIPQFFYGSEVLFTSPKERDDGAVRADMPGGWPGDKVNAFTGKGLSSQQADAQQFIKTLFNWRKKTPLAQTGKLEHFVPEEGVYVYFRYDDKHRIMVILNKNTQPYTLDLSRFKRLLSGATQAHDVLRNQTLVLTQTLALTPGTPSILELQ